MQLLRLYILAIFIIRQKPQAILFSWKIDKIEI